MFRCQICQTVVPPKTATQKLVVKSRPKEYAARGSDPRERRFRSRFAPPVRQQYDKGGEGTEIVQELSVCPECARKYGPQASQQ